MTATNLPALFDDHGRRIPFAGVRVFNRISRRYYQLNQPPVRFETVLARIAEHTKTDKMVSAKTFESTCLDLMRLVKDNPSLQTIFQGVHVPFVCPKTSTQADIGEEFEKLWLPAVSRSFTQSYSQYHFKRAVHGDSTLKGKLSLAEKSRYERLLQARQRGTVVGWYFPEALQEYDLASQRSQIDTLPLPETLVLSGGFDVAAALIGSPDLLMNEQTYPPVLCLSAFQHADPRLMLCFKAYGPSLEFWCMSQMLTPTLTQVSEQWAGGLTLFTTV